MKNVIPAQAGIQESKNIDSCLHRNDRRWGIFAFLFLIFDFFIIVPLALPFNIPERLEYNLTWAGIKAGTASLEVVNDVDKIKIISTAQSAKWVSVFYKVDDRVESTLIKNQTSMSHRDTNGNENVIASPDKIGATQSSDRFGTGSAILKKKIATPSARNDGIKGLSGESLFIGKPLNYRLKIREGSRRSDKEVIFNPSNNKVTYINHLKKEEKKFDVPTFVFDPISGFYYLRTLQLEVGKPVYMTIFDDKKVWNVEVQVLRKERVKVPVGEFDTIVVKPLIQSEGIFYRKGDIHIWLTDDERRIPVMVKTKVSIGSITATLVRGNY